MHTKIIVRKEDVAKCGVEEALLLLSKIIYSEPGIWAFIPADSLPTLIRTLDSYQIPYGVESNDAFSRQRPR